MLFAALLGFAQEYRGERALEALRHMAAPPRRHCALAKPAQYRYFVRARGSFSNRLCAVFSASFRDLRYERGRHRARVDDRARSRVIQVARPARLVGQVRVTVRGES